MGIYSAGYNTDINKDEYIKQLSWFGISLIFLVFVWSIDYKVFGIVGYIIYGLSLMALVAVLFTTPMLGAKRWFNIGPILYQPTEFMKIGYILTLSKILTYYSFDDMSKQQKIVKFVLISALLIIPCILIMLQPDLGTAIAYICITAFMLYASKLKYRYIFILLALVLLLTPIIYTYILTPIQQNRILVFLDPTLDPLGSGYNALQSKLAVGSGMIFGTGILKGTQTQYGYLPIKSSDFIFAVLSEEMGFIMSAIIVILFVTLIIRLIRISARTDDLFGKYIAIGIAGMMFFHFAENIGMTIGLLPITGIPLPFVSYGGSSLITNIIIIAIALNISARKNTEFTF